MIPLSLLPFAAQGIAGLMQAGSGLLGMSAKRPEYHMPTEIKQSTGLANQLFNSDTPQYGQNREAAEVAASNAYKQASETGQGMNAAAAIQGNLNKQYSTLAGQNAAYKTQNAGVLQNALNNQAEYADREWQINKYAPYADKVQQGRQMFGAGLSNLFGATTGAMNFQKYDDLLKGMNQSSNINANLSTPQRFGSLSQLPMLQGGASLPSMIPTLKNLPN